MEKEKKIGLVAVLFFLLYIVLPSYFAIEISESFPLITASRILLLILIISYILVRRGVIKIKIFRDSSLKYPYLIYFSLMMISNFYYVPMTSEAVKQILILILEELLVIWIISNIVTSKDNLVFCLKMMSISAGIVACISIISSLIGKNIFYYLITINRSNILASNYLRLGFIRAEAGFGHAVYYGAYCVFMIPVIMYVMETQKKKGIYSICLFLDIIALVFANSRGSLVIGAILIAYMLIKKKPKYLKKYIVVLLILIVLLTIIYFTNETIKNFLYNIFVSITIIFDSNNAEIENYGNNSLTGLKSRTSQITQMTYGLKQNLFFGLVANAHNRGVLKWYTPWTGEWQITKTIDVGYVGVVAQYGIIGGIAFLVLYLAILFSIFDKKSKSDDLMQMFKYVFIAYFLMMLSISGVHDFFWVVFGLFIAYKNILYEKEIR